MKRILITGANRGLGLEFTRQYLERGDRVLAGCRSPENALALKELMLQHGDRLKLLPLDVGREMHRANAMATAVACFHGLDLLINNAGIFPKGPNNRPSEEAMCEAFRINVAAPILLSLQLVPVLLKGESPLIVMISSGLGSIARTGDFGSWSEFAYGPSKAALNRAGRQLAIDLKPKGIGVLLQSPGWVRTDMGGEDADLSPEESISAMISLFDAFEMPETGSFLSLDGKQIPW